MKNKSKNNIIIVAAIICCGILIASIIISAQVVGYFFGIGRLNGLFKGLTYCLAAIILTYKLAFQYFIQFIYLAEKNAEHKRNMLAFLTREVSFLYIRAFRMLAEKLSRFMQSKTYEKYEFLHKGIIDFMLKELISTMRGEKAEEFQKQYHKFKKFIAKSVRASRRSFNVIHRKTSELFGNILYGAKKIAEETFGSAGNAVEFAFIMAELFMFYLTIRLATVCVARGLKVFTVRSGVEADIIWRFVLAILVYTFSFLVFKSGMELFRKTAAEKMKEWTKKRFIATQEQYVAGIDRLAKSTEKRLALPLFLMPKRMSIALLLCIAVMKR